MLEITIDARGRVSDVKVFESADPEFDAAAIAAARQFEFVPAEFDGVPGPIRIHYKYDFRLPAPPPEPVKASLSGVVRDETTGEPIAGVTVEVEGGGSAVTDEEGRFTIEGLEEGEHVVRLFSPAFGAIQTMESIAAGEQLSVAYELSPPPPFEDEEDGDDMEIVVLAPVIRREVVESRLTAEEARSVPGTGGDVVRVVESLPGVGRSAVGSGQLVVWGASPEDTRVYMDGVPLPRLYHEGGLRSVIHPSFVESIALIPGGAGAAYGRGLGGVILVESRGPTQQGLHGMVGVDLLDATASLGYRDEKGNYQAAAGRFGLLDQFAKVAGDDATELVPIPRFWDGQARVGYRLRDGSTLDVVGIVTGDRYSRGVPNPDPALVTRDFRELDVVRVYARYRRQDEDGTTVEVIPWVGYDRTYRGSSYGSLTTFSEIDAARLGLRSSYGKRVAPWLTLRAGVDIELVFDSHDRSGSIGLPSREGDIRVFGQAPPDTISTDHFSTRQIGVAPYVEGTLSFVDGKLQITPGLRLDPYARSVSRRLPANGRIPEQGAFLEDLAVEPRLIANYEAASWLSLRGSVGRYRRQPLSEDLSAAFGNPTLPTARATQALAGFAVKPVDRVELEVVGFHSRSDHLAMRSPDPTPALASALAATGEGRASGVQGMLRGSIDPGLFGWIAYTYSKAERKNGPDQAYRLFDYDQTHVLTLVAGWTSKFGLELSGRFRYASGMPRTEVIGTYYDAVRDRMQPIFGRHNDIRLPSFVQLDVRAGYSKEFEHQAFMAYLELQNVTNRRNVEEYIYSPDFTERKAIYGLPFLPVLGLQWSF